MQLYPKLSKTRLILVGVDLDLGIRRNTAKHFVKQANDSDMEPLYGFKFEHKDWLITLSPVLVW